MTAVATLAIIDISDHQAVSDLERKRIEVMRRMVEDNIVRVDYRHAPDGLAQFAKLVAQLSQQSHRRT